MKRILTIVLLWNVLQLNAGDKDELIASMQVTTAGADDIRKAIREVVGCTFNNCLHNRYLLREDPAFHGRIPQTYLKGHQYFAQDLERKSLPLSDVVYLTKQHLAAYSEAVSGGNASPRFQSALLFSLLRHNKMALQELQRCGHYNLQHIEELKLDAHKY